MSVVMELWPLMLIAFVVTFLFVPYDRGMGCGWARPRIIDVVKWLYRKLQK